MHSNAKNKFKHGIGFGFLVVVYTYETPGRATNWGGIFKFPLGIHTDNPGVIRCISDADKNVPIFLSRRETKYRIDSIRLATGKKNFNKKMSEALLSSILKYGSTPVFCEST